MKASVTVNKKIVSSIDSGLLIFLGVKNDDSSKDVEYLVKKIINMRIFSSETSDNLKDWPSHKFAKPPKNPIIHNNNKSLPSGITHPKGIVNKLAKVIAIEKYKDISHTGSVVDSCLIAIAT